jgi:acyl-CoA dehydrogenase
MADRSFLQWPFFDDVHRDIADRADEWAASTLGDIDHSNLDTTCKTLVSALGDAGWLRLTAVDPTDDTSRIDVRSLCILRETLARHDGLADFAFAMQGLGTGAISLFGTAEQKTEWLSLTREGKALSAFALSEPASGPMWPTWP